MSTTITSDQLEIVQDLNMQGFELVGELPDPAFDGQAALSLNVGAQLRGGDGSAANPGTPGTLQAGGGDNGNTRGGAFYADGGKGDGVTNGKVQITTNGVDGVEGYTLVGVTHPDIGFALEHKNLGAITLDDHAAPADGELAAGELRLWFDQTDGAAKLMIKAKQANGTVRTAAVNLA